MMNKIYVGNLPYSINEPQLEEGFSKFGEIVEAFLVKDRDSGRLKGFGFVTFATQAAAQAALAMDGQEFHGRNLKVSMAREKEEGGRSGGGGGGAGRRGGARW